MIKVLELFGGIGACTKALERLGIDHEVVDYVEIDKYAVKSFNAIHGTNFEPQDIKEWNKDIDVDLIMHGSPCQDFSVAGKGAGGDKDSGTRSSLMYETLRIVEKLKPKYVIWENVKNLLSKKHIHNFEAYQEAMERLGYKNFYKVLNAKDYGVPQNRERVFTVSIRDDIPGDFQFPEPEPLKIRLKDVLEDNVDEKYYIKDATSLTAGSNFDTINGGTIGKMHDISRRAYHEDAIAPAMHTCGGGNTEPKIVASRGRNVMGSSETEQHLEVNNTGTTNTITSVAKDNYVAEPVGGGIAVKTANKKGYDIATDGDCINLQFPNSATRRGRVGHGVSQTLQATDGMGVVVEEPKVIGGIGEKKSNGGTQWFRQDRVYDDKVATSITAAFNPYYKSSYRIRKLTPKECWRLMGFDDSDFEKAEKVNSNTQLYKQAGNSIVVNVLEGILKNLIKED